MKLAAMRRPLGSFGRPLLALGVTIIFALALESGVAFGMGHGGGGAGGGGSGGGHAGGGGSGGGHAGSSAGSGHTGTGHVGSVGGHGGGQLGGGQFAAGHFGHVPGGHGVFCDHHHGHGFGGLVAVGLPFGVPSYSEYPPYPPGADPYCDPSSPWYNPAYCHWRHRDE